MKEVARNEQIIETAIMTKHPLEIALAVIKTTIKGNLQHKNLTLNKAIIKYFEKEIGLNISFQNFHTRPETEYGEDNKINPMEFIVYGVDFLTTGNIKDRFNLTDLKQSELVWVNSSVCKLKYLSADAARTVLESVIEDVKGLKVKVDEDSEVIPIGKELYYL